MVEEKMNDLKGRVLEEMTTNYSSALEKNFELAKQFIRITKNGKVEILFKERLTGKERILLYLIGKLYAKEAELASSEEAGNKELMDELGMCKGSLLPWLKDLRAEGAVKPMKRGKFTNHTISINFVEDTLKSIEKKVSKEV